MFDHVIYPLIIAGAIVFGVDRERSPDGYLLWWPPSMWRAPSWRAVRLGAIALSAGVAASFVPWWVILPLVVVGFTISWLRQRRKTSL